MSQDMSKAFTKYDYVGATKGERGFVLDAETNFVSGEDSKPLEGSDIHFVTELDTKQGKLTIYGIHVDAQSEELCARYTPKIMEDMSKKAGKEFNGAIAVVGTCFPASPLITKVGEVWLKSILDRPENESKIFTSGVMDYDILDNDGNPCRGVNSQVAHLTTLDSKYADRLITLLNDGATLWDSREPAVYLSTNGFEGQALDVGFPKFLKNVMLVYSDGKTEEKGEALGFGRDSIEFISKLFKLDDAGEIVQNNSSIICMGGGLQSLAELLRALKYGINSYVLNGVKSANSVVPQWEDKEVELFSASKFLEKLQNKLAAKKAESLEAELEAKEVASLLDEYLFLDQTTIDLLHEKCPEFEGVFREFAHARALPAFPKAHDIDGKPAQLKKLIELLFDHQLYKSDSLSLIEMSNVDDLAGEYQAQGLLGGLFPQEEAA